MRERHRIEASGITCGPQRLPAEAAAEREGDGKSEARANGRRGLSAEMVAAEMGAGDGRRAGYGTRVEIENLPVEGNKSGRRLIQITATTIFTIR